VEIAHAAGETSVFVPATGTPEKSPLRIRRIFFIFRRRNDKLILMYHNMAEEADFNTVALHAFEAQVRLIRSERSFVSLDEYVRRLEAGGDGSDCAALTFDDGYVSFRTLALPVLEKNALPAALFIPVNHAGETNIWEKTDYPVYTLLSWEEIALAGAHELVTIGSHSLSHRSLRKLPAEDQLDEVAVSKRELENRTGLEIHHFSYPYGQRLDFSGETIRLVQENGYRSACSTLYGRTNRAGEKYRLRRIEVRPHDTLERFNKVCSGNMHSLYIKQRIKEIVHVFPV
jgi:peptidoglycan/xylan/chitin deacetylase (PgdA/CDA1 family)